MNFFTNIVLMKGQTKWILGVTAAQAAEVLAVGTVVILPFTLNFETMVQGGGGPVSFPSSSAFDPVGASGDSDCDFCDRSSGGKAQRRKA